MHKELTVDFKSIGASRSKHLPTVQELLGINDVRTTLIYTHVLQRGGLAVKSPLDP